MGQVGVGDSSSGNPGAALAGDLHHAGGGGGCSRRRRVLSQKAFFVGETELARNLVFLQWSAEGHVSEVCSEGGFRRWHGC